MYSDITITDERQKLVVQLLAAIIAQANITQAELMVACAELCFANGTANGVRMAKEEFKLERQQANQPKNNIQA